MGENPHHAQRQRGSAMRATIIRYGDIDKRFAERDPESRQYKRRILAEGDSWFTMGSVPGSNVLFHVQTSVRTALVSIAKPGDTIVRMGDSERMLQLERLLTVPRFSYAFDAILLSGGGNDLIDSAPDLLIGRTTPRTNPADYVDTISFKAFATKIRSAYTSIVAVRDSPNSGSVGKPIYVHTYDYPTPRDSPTRFLGAGIVGPWLFPAFMLAGIPQDMWTGVADHLLDGLAETLLSMDSVSGSDPLPNVVVVDTRNTLKRARLGKVTADGDWANEIHPNTAGYRKIGRKLSAYIAL